MFILFYEHCYTPISKLAATELNVYVLQVIRMVGESQEAVGVGAGSGQSSNKMPTLEEYGTNLTTQATEVDISFNLITCCLL